MKSYVSIDRIEGEYAVCEVELVDTETSKILSAREKDTEMVDIPMQGLVDCIGEVAEGDIIVVEQENGIVFVAYGKDEEEKQRRVELLKSIMSK